MNAYCLVGHNLSAHEGHSSQTRETRKSFSKFRLGMNSLKHSTLRFEGQAKILPKIMFSQIHIHLLRFLIQIIGGSPLIPIHSLIYQYKILDLNVSHPRSLPIGFSYLRSSTEE